ncbi:unnamed protein product [Orchesella dallaii]|uniref:gamma-glutamylcyclotransferase n=1 Tax=Orchesella dallaii TaxID=48710 RepID=A0ABP1RTX5_9HEXA
MQSLNSTFRQIFVKDFLFVRTIRKQNFRNQVKLSLRMMGTEAEKGTFLYFAYGSNLWTKRIHENNRTATMVAVGKLEGHRLDFGHWTQRWRGASANILAEEGSHVYGVLWELNQCDQASLDKQEGVLDNIYQRVELTVETVPDGKKVNCMAYRIRDETRQKSVLAHGENLIPSLRYKNVIIQGAKEHGLPEEYVKFLEAVPDNGYNGDVDVNIPLTT